MAAAVGSVGAKLEAVVAETDPDDYPLLIALLRSTLRTLTEHLDETPLALAILLEKKLRPLRSYCRGIAKEERPMADSLTSDARFLVERCPEIVNALAVKLGDRFDIHLLMGSRFNVPGTRLEKLRTLPIVSLAEFLEHELGDGLPVDWFAWLTEEVALGG